MWVQAGRLRGFRLSAQPILRAFDRRFRPFCSRLEDAGNSYVLDGQLGVCFQAQSALQRSRAILLCYLSDVSHVSRVIPRFGRGAELAISIPLTVLQRTF